MLMLLLRFSLQDKLSEEVQKRPDEPVENDVRLPVAPLEAEPDGGQEDRTKPLLERLKALEVGRGKLTLRCV